MIISLSVFSYQVRRNMRLNALTRVCERFESRKNQLKTLYLRGFDVLLLLAEFQT